MADRSEQGKTVPVRKPTGEKYKADLDRVAARNDEARKAAKRVRQANEQKEAARRRAASAKERADMSRMWP